MWTLSPTPHRVETGGHRLYAWCAADAMGMPPAIGRTVRVSSARPATGQTITVTATPGDVRTVQPPGAVVSAIITGDPGDIRGSPCNLGHFFASRDAAAGWAAEHADRRFSASPMPSITPAASCGCSSMADRRPFERITKTGGPLGSC
jgi:alkylmercury lyase